MEAGEISSWRSDMPSSQRMQLGQGAFKSQVGPNIVKMQKLAKDMGSMLKKHPLFDGYRVEVVDKGIRGGDFSYVSWEAEIIMDSRSTLKFAISARIKPKDGHSVYGGATTYELLPSSYSLTAFPNAGSPQSLFQGDTVPSPAACKKALEIFTLERILKGVGGPKKGKFNGVVTIDEVKKFVDRLNTWFNLESDTHNSLSYASREYGDVGEEKAGKQDQDEASRIHQALRTEFGAAVNVEVDVVDEWVSIDVSLP